MPLTAAVHCVCYRYNPCFASTYDYPSRYVRDGTEPSPLILKGKGIHWRSSRSVTVTYALRLHVLQDLVRLRGKHAALPNPCCDYPASHLIHTALGIFTPLPALSTHRHESHEHDANPDAHIGSPDFPLERLMAQGAEWVEKHGNVSAAIRAP